MHRKDRETCARCHRHQWADEFGGTAESNANIRLTVWFGPRRDELRWAYRSLVIRSKVVDGLCSRSKKWRETLVNVRKVAGGVFSAFYPCVGGRKNSRAVLVCFPAAVWPSNYSCLIIHRSCHVKHEYHSASAIRGVIFMITLVAISGGTVPRIAQDREKDRRGVDVKTSCPVSDVHLLPSDPPCVFEIGVCQGASEGASNS